LIRPGFTQRFAAAVVGFIAAAAGCASQDGARVVAPAPAAAPRGAASPRPAPPWLREIQDEVEALRERPFLRPVPYEAQTRESFREYVRGELAHDLPPQKAADASKALVALGFVPEGFDVGAAMERAMVTQVLAYYDTKLRAFRVIGASRGTDGSPPARGVVAHELTHALADQHFDLEAYGGEKAGDALDDDEKLARRCVVEGEATFLMNALELATGRGGQVHLGPLAVAGLRMAVAMTSAAEPATLVALTRAGQDPAKMDDDAREELDALTKLPLVVTMPMVEPYLKGASLVSDVWGAGGWAAVDGLFKHAPQSTEQVLHPGQKLLAGRDVPIRVRLPAQPPPLPGPPGATRLVESNVFGELGWRIYFKTWHLGDADTAAAGWGGDRYWVWERGRRVVTVLATTWDGEAEAARFAAAYEGTLSHRFPRAVAGQLTEGKGEGLRVLVAPGRSIVVERRGRDVDVIDGADDAERASLRAALAAATRTPAGDHR
jgi:hypothetical protein